MTIQTYLKICIYRIGNDQIRQSLGIMKTLIIILITVILTLSCIRLGESIIMSSIPVGKTYYMVGEPTTKIRGKLLTTTEDISEKQPKVMTTYSETSNEYELALKLRSNVQHPNTTNRSLKLRYVRDNRLKTIPTTLERKIFPFVILGKMIKKNQYMTKRDDNCKNTAVKNDSNIKSAGTAMVNRKSFNGKNNK